MKKYLIIVLATGIVFMNSCTRNDAVDTASKNPFFTEWNTPFGVPPFEKIKLEHYRPALDSGFKAHNVEIEAIVSNPEPPTFENTILALEHSGFLLNNVASVFYNVVGADGDEPMKEIEAEYAPKFSAHADEMYMNEALFAKVKAVYDQKDKLGLDSDDTRLIEYYYKNFVRGGTNLPANKKAELKEINNKISGLTTQFGQRLLAENNAFKVVVDKKEDLAGLPESSIAAAAELAKQNEQAGKWMFNTSKPSWIPFMQYADNRALREKMYKGYVNRGNNNDANDTKDLVEQIAILRVKKANLLGYKTWADYVISDNMAKTAKAANDLITKVAKTTIPYAKAEAIELQKIANKLGRNTNIEPWDWWYYTEKLRSEKYALDESMIRPYFALENVKQGLFDLTNKLYGLKYKKLDNMPTYNKECEVYEVLNSNDSHLSVIYFDWYPRPTKRAGAWMNAIRDEYFLDGKRIAPIVINVCNFTRPMGDVPALISIDEAETLFHEFGHALHGMFANTKYRSTSGTATPRDYVELPSQIMENWVCHPEFIKTWAKHYKTGEVIPDSLIAKIDASAKFNQGFVTLELIAAAILDMEWHMIKDTNKRNAINFEAEVMKRLGMIPEILPRYSSWYFNHIWGSDFGYSAGYYGYTWSAVLDADAFEAFVETGDIYNKEIATKFRDNVLMLGASYDAGQLYRQFRGKDPSSDAFFKRKGFISKK
jgi:peptidyl-dipeptidase Dcp